MLLRSTFARRALVSQRSIIPGTIHQYATTAQEGGRVALRDDLKKYLKPEVLKIIESKTDTVLIKKLNFLGRNFVCRLNVANNLILNSLSQDNVFRLLVKDLEDPWTYYWQRIRKNGKDGAKWLESLKEVSHLPAVVDRCFREMTLSGVYPSTEHFNTYMHAMADYSDSRTFHQFHDELNRANQTNKPNGETYQAMAFLWAKQGNFFLANHTAAYMRKKGWPVSSELESLLQKLKATYDPAAAAAFYQGKGEKPAFIKEKERLFAENQAKIVNTVEACLQPPLEKLVVVDQQ